MKKWDLTPKDPLLRALLDAYHVADDGANEGKGVLSERLANIIRALLMLLTQTKTRTKQAELLAEPSQWATDLLLRWGTVPILGSSEERAILEKWCVRLDPEIEGKASYLAGMPIMPPRNLAAEILHEDAERLLVASWGTTAIIEHTRERIPALFSKGEQISADPVDLLLVGFTIEMVSVDLELMRNRSDPLPVLRHAHKSRYEELKREPETLVKQALREEGFSANSTRSFFNYRAQRETRRVLSPPRGRPK